MTKPMPAALSAGSRQRAWGTRRARYGSNGFPGRAGPAPRGIPAVCACGHPAEPSRWHCPVCSRWKPALAAVCAECEEGGADLTASQELAAYFGGAA